MPVCECCLEYTDRLNPLSHLGFTFNICNDCFQALERESQKAEVFA